MNPYKVVEYRGKIQIRHGWTIVAELNEDKQGYIDVDLGKRRWNEAMANAQVMVDALNAASVESEKAP